MPEKKYDLAAAIRSELDRHKRIPLDIGEKRIWIDPPILWPPEVSAAVDDNVKAMKLLIGEKNYKAFCAQTVEVDGVTYHGTAEMFWADLNARLGATRPESNGSTSS